MHSPPMPAVKVTGGAPAHGDEPAEPAFYVDDLFVPINFVVDKARELSMPAVMLLNLGSIGGPTDGTSALSRKITRCRRHRFAVAFVFSVRRWGFLNANGSDINFAAAD